MNRFKHAVLALAGKVDYVTTEQDIEEHNESYTIGYDDGQDDLLEQQLDSTAKVAATAFRSGYNAGVQAHEQTVIDLLNRISRELTAADPDDGAE